MIRLELDQLNWWSDRRTRRFRSVQFFYFLFPSLSLFPSNETPTPLEKLLFSVETFPATPLEHSLSPHWKSPTNRTPTTLAKPTHDPTGIPPPTACARAGKVFLARRNPPHQKPPPSPVLEPLAREKSKSFPLFARRKPPTRRQKWKPTPQNPIAHSSPLFFSSSRFFLIIFYLISFLFISFYIYYFFIL